MGNEVSSVCDILSRVEELAAGRSEVDGNMLVRSFGRRSYGPLLLLPALLEISPLSGVPGFASVMALLIALIAAQAILGRECIWLPNALSKRSLSSSKVRKASATMRPLAERLDRWFHGRLRRLTGGAAVRVAAVACLLLACTVPFLDFVPFASTAPMAAIALFGLALLVHDGVLMVVAFVAAIAAVAFVASLLV